MAHPRSTRRHCLLLLAACQLVAACAAAQSKPVVIDQVVAVVNGHAILMSDIQAEMELSVLDPNNREDGKLSPQLALEQLISRALIQQQIRDQDIPASEPAANVVQARIQELRKDLPACAHTDCASAAGWDALLAARGLDEHEVEAYIKLRLQILSFIENRFRQGIRIPEEDVENYYRTTLLPQYGGRPAPPLKEVAPRISEILLEQRVNQLFDTWLDNLMKEGDVEILDPSLKPSQPLDASKAGGL